VDERLEEYLKRLDEGDVAEAGTNGSRASNSTGGAIADQDSLGRKSAFFDGVFIFGEV